jgi:hypothetical protein
MGCTHCATTTHPLITIIIDDTPTHLCQFCLTRNDMLLHLTDFALREPEQLKIIFPPRHRHRGSNAPVSEEPLGKRPPASGVS